ncbi:TetR/AcrR family transcriptional regulator [Acidaminobacter hydrogenoformans]|uniref:Transcriptional regulator, TetR family n=1 Tax=Acidaminobacter hydrogenoformans DSM 2784 TaxID=1120920 RepID=A0A1G5S6V2_9FIRM|nr:TetR/AcrR family transcriptional regulator [Acidaminobacter hydrogenoformans]SCZ81600.1 transcriptional regulator, TetR family [Acidaminobacter hydrogenoformans DSM 2784]
MIDKIIKEVQSLSLETGLKKMTMDGLSDRLKISKKTLYEHFNSKDELIYQTIHEYISENQRILANELNNANTYIEKLKIACYHYLPYPIEFYKTNIEEIERYYPSSAQIIHNYIGESSNMIVQVYNDGITNGVFNEQINPEVLIELSKSFLLTIPEIKDRQGITSSFFEILLYGSVKR